MATPDGTTDQILTPPEAAKLLRIGRNAIYELVARGKVPHRRVGRQIRFSRAALLAWLARADDGSVGTWSSQVAGEEQ